MFLFDSPLFQMTGRYINWRRSLTDRNIFSGKFWLAITYSAASFDWPLYYLYIITGEIWLAAAYSAANFDLQLC